MNLRSEETSSLSRHATLGRDSLKVFSIAIAYFLAHQIAFFFPDSERVIMLVWPAGGVGLAAFLLSPRRLWPMLTFAFYVSGIAADVFLAGRSFLTGFGFMSGNMVESIGCAWIILHWSPDFRRFDRVREVIALIAGTILVNAISSSIGAGTSVLTRGASFADAWISWYVSDGLGLLLIGPFLVVFARDLKSFAALRIREIAEALGIMIVWTLGSLHAFFPGAILPVSDMHPYVLIPLLAWPAIRLGQRGVTLALLILFVIAVISPATNIGPSLWGATPDDVTHRILELQLFLSFSAVVAYLLSAGYANLKKTEVALRESENKFRLLHESAGVGIGYYTPEGKVISYNTIAANHMGGRPEDFAGKSAAALFPQALADMYLQRIRGAVESRETSEFEDIVELPSGPKWFVSTFSRVLDSSDNVIGVQIISLDITIRKLAEQKLEQSEKKFSTVFRDAPVWITITDMVDATYIDVNEQALKASGFCRKEVVGHTADDLGWISSEDRARLVREIQEHGRFEGLELTFRAKDGHTLHGLANGEQIVLNGRRCLLTVTLDLTDRLRAEEALKLERNLMTALLQNTPDHIYFKDSDSRFLKLSKSLADRFGIANPEAAIGKSDFDFFEPEHANSAFDDEQAILKTGRTLTDREEMECWPDGSVTWVSTTKAPLRDAQGKTIGTFGISRDITGRRHAEEVQRESEDRYRSLVGNSLEAILLTVADGSIVSANPAACELFGYSEKELIALGRTSIMDARDPRLQEALETRNRTGSFHGELTFVAKGGTTFSGEMTTAIYLDRNGRQLTSMIIRDISERRKAEETLRASEERFKRTFKFSGSGMALVAPDFHFLQANDAFCTMLGYSESELVTKTYQDVTYPEDRDRGGVLVARLLSNEIGFFQLEKRYVRKDGSLVWGMATCTLIRDNQDQPLHIIAQVQDVTEHKRSLEKTSRLAAIVQSTDDAITSETLDGTVTSWNKGAELVYQYSETEMVGNSMSVLVPLNRKNELREISSKIRMGIHIEHYETRRHRKDGRQLEVSLSISPLRDADGIVIGASTIARDITGRNEVERALRESEERYRKLIETMPDGVYRSTHDGKFLEVNPAMVKMLGYDSKEELLSIDIKTDLYFAAGDRESAALEEKLEEMAMFRLRKKDGSEIWVEDHGRHVVDEEGRVLYHEGVLRDVTDRLRAETALRQAQKLESIGTLAGGIAHDFNNLLNAMLGQSTLAMTKLPKESLAHDHIVKSINAAERAADLTRQLLAYSGKGKFATEEIDLNRLVKENVQMLEVSVPKSTQLKFELGSPAPHVRADVGQIQQVIMNLIINAGESMAGNPGYIVVCTGQIEIKAGDSEYWRYSGNALVPGSYALLQVSDTGCGMKPEVLARIFDPFFTTKFTGRGLGLAAVLGIIRSHKGGIRITSAESSGTRFDVVLPLVNPSPMLAPEDTARSSMLTGDGMTILVIDDEPSVLELLTDFLTEEGFEVIGALNPVEGIDLYRQHQAKTSLVVLDYSMPNLGGKEVFEKLIQINKEVKVLICSGYAEEEIESAFGVTRPSGFIHKPYSPTAFLKKMSDLLEG